MSAVDPTPEPPITYRGKTVIRAIGCVLLTACAVMLILGVTVLSGRLRGPQYMLYWSGCFLITVAALFTALWDMLMLRRASKQTRRRLFREQFMTPDFIDKVREKDRKNQ